MKPTASTTILWRVCWNDCGWQKPSGGFKEAGYPADHGFGHEEWNFRLDDAIDGWLYGYVYKTRLKRAGATFRIVFFAIEPDTKERIVVGIYHAAEFIESATRENLAAAFERRGIFRRRAAELRRATGNRYSQREALEFVRNAVSDPVLMVRCRRADIEIPRTRIPLRRVSCKQSVGHRFKSFTYLEDDAYFGRSGRPAFLSARRWLKPRQGELSEEAYPRVSSATRKIIVPRHRRLATKSPVVALVNVSATLTPGSEPLAASVSVAVVPVLRVYAKMLHQEHGKNLGQTMKLGEKINVTPIETAAVDHPRDARRHLQHVRTQPARRAFLTRPPQ